MKNAQTAHAFDFLPLKKELHVIYSNSSPLIQAPKLPLLPHFLPVNVA